MCTLGIGSLPPQESGDNVAPRRDFVVGAAAPGFRTLLIEAIAALPCWDLIQLPLTDTSLVYLWLPTMVSTCTTFEVATSIFAFRVVFSFPGFRDSARSTLERVSHPSMVDCRFGLTFPLSLVKKCQIRINLLVTSLATLLFQEAANAEKSIDA